MRTILYARYSSDLQNAKSAADQLADLRDRCAREGWTILGEYVDEEISGAAGLGPDQRPGMSAALARVEAGGVDYLMADSTSRLARDRGDSFELRELVEQAGGRLFTLADGVVSEMTEWAKGFVDSQHRKDLAHNIRRGQGGTVRDGRVAAGLAYGYRVANTFDDRGRPVRGLREIDQAKAAIVLRIFTELAAGESPRAIAARLNAAGIPGPTGRVWRGSTIGGERKRGTGIARNRTYIGEIVHFRTTKVVDRRTRRTLIKPLEDSRRVVGQAEHLRIVPQPVWEAAQAQLDRYAGAGQGGQPGAALNRTHRPKHLLSGLIKCGTCGGGFNIISSRTWACGRHRDGRACTNNRQIETHTLEAKVLAGLREKMLDPEAVAVAVRHYTDESGRARRAMERDRALLAKARREAEARVGRLVDAIANGVDVEEVREALAKARAERDAAAAAAAEIDAEESVITLHPRLADRYREWVGQLLDQLKDPEQRLEAVPILRSLIDRVVLSPKRRGRGCEVRLEGRLANLVALATGKPADLLPTVSLERVKGTRRKHRFLRAKV